MASALLAVIPATLHRQVATVNAPAPDSRFQVVTDPIQRQADRPECKAGYQSEDNSLQFVMSDETVDRMGDIVKADGWDLASFKRNPIALLNHDHNLPIGVWKNVRVVGKQLLGELELAKQGTSELIDTVRSLVEQRVLRAVSVGFMPTEFQPRDKEKPWGGDVISKQTLLETSLVAVPANPAALSVAKALSPHHADQFFLPMDPRTGEAQPHPGHLADLKPRPKLALVHQRMKSLGIDTRDY